jgi:hypothetical protein
VRSVNTRSVGLSHAAWAAVLIRCWRRCSRRSASTVKASMCRLRPRPPLGGSSSAFRRWTDSRRRTRRSSRPQSTSSQPRARSSVARMPVKAAMIQKSRSRWPRVWSRKAWSSAIVHTRAPSALVVVDLRQGGPIGWVAQEDPGAECVVEGLVEHAVHILDRDSREGTSVPAATREQVGVEAVQVAHVQLGERDVAEVRGDVAADSACRYWSQVAGRTCVACVCAQSARYADRVTAVSPVAVGSTEAIPRSRRPRGGRHQ